MKSAGHNSNLDRNCEAKSILEPTNQPPTPTTSLPRKHLAVKSIDPLDHR